MVNVDISVEFIYLTQTTVLNITSKTLLKAIKLTFRTYSLIKFCVILSLILVVWISL